MSFRYDICYNFTSDIVLRHGLIVSYHYNVLWRVECEICSTIDIFDLRCESATHIYFYVSHFAIIKLMKHEVICEWTIC